MLLPFTRSETLGLAQAHILLYKLFLQTNFIKTCERSLLDKNLNCLLSEKMNGCQIYQKILHIDPSLGFEWSKKGRVSNGLDFEWDLKREIGQKRLVFKWLVL